MATATLDGPILLNEQWAGDPVDEVENGRLVEKEVGACKFWIASSLIHELGLHVGIERIDRVFSETLFAL